MFEYEAARGTVRKQITFNDLITVSNVHIATNQQQGVSGVQHFHLLEVSIRALLWIVLQLNTPSVARVITSPTQLSRLFPRTGTSLQTFNAVF